MDEHRFWCGVCRMGELVGRLRDFNSAHVRTDDYNDFICSVGGGLIRWGLARGGAMGLFFGLRGFEESSEDSLCPNVLAPFQINNMARLYRLLRQVRGLKG